MSLEAGETVILKRNIEKWIDKQATAEVIHYYTYSGIFTADMLHQDCDLKDQSQRFWVLDLNIRMLELRDPSKQ